MNAFWFALLVWQARVGSSGSNPKCREVRVPPSDSASDLSVELDQRGYIVPLSSVQQVVFHSGIELDVFSGVECGVQCRCP